MVTKDMAPNQTPNERKPPFIHEDYIFGKSDGEETDGSIEFGADITDSMIYGITGARGSGKSETLCAFGVRALAMGLPVWSNFPIKFYLLQHHKDPVLCESQALMFKDLFAMDEKLRGGLIIIDEYQDWANNLSFMSTQNKLLHSFWAQMRKNDLCFAYAAKKLRWIDLKTREETDIEIQCRDMHKDPEYRRNHAKGEKIFHNIIDWSGNWTGKSYEDDPTVYMNQFEAKFLWNAYDTRQRFDVFEAMRGLKLDLEKQVISDKDNGESFNAETTEQMLIGLFKRDSQWKAAELFDTLGIPVKLRARVGVLLKDMGAKEKNTNHGRYFIFDPDLDMKEDIDKLVSV